ncbi:hypothetical protein LINGRAHAP2_LOCUS29319 [Linum grandiflorum]
MLLFPYLLSQTVPTTIVFNCSGYYSVPLLWILSFPCVYFPPPFLHHLHCMFLKQKTRQTERRSCC